MSTEKQVRKRVRTNVKKQLDDLILYCKVQIEVLDGIAEIHADPATITGQDHYFAGRSDSYKALLKRLGVEVPE